MYSQKLQKKSRTEKQISFQKFLNMSKSVQKFIFKSQFACNKSKTPIYLFWISYCINSNLFFEFFELRL